MTLNACVFLSFSINQAKKLNCLFIYLFIFYIRAARILRLEKNCSITEQFRRPKTFLQG